MISGISKASAYLLLVLAFTIWILNGLVDDWGRLSGSGANLVTFFHESLWPPDWSVIGPQVYPVCTAYPIFDFTCSTAWIGMMETIKIAFVSTVMGTIISLPIGILAARNLNSKIVSYSARLILAASRSLPSIIWAIFFVILVGFGPLSGVLAMTIYTVGYLGKLQYEAIEGMPNTPLEAASSMGLSKLETSLGVVIPESANHLISQAIFMFEYNVRHGTVIGIVGAGGIGYHINLYMKFLQYDKVIAYLIIIFAVVIVIDFLSIYARSFFNEEGDVRRPPWLGVLLPADLAIRVGRDRSQ
ncbi:MAG: phosphonate ABC transporter, permease protein PhnE [Candidatus Thalassarchaeaceae archaeon]|jgi:phosphonate ABC transporter permease subunit PhnE|nr:phosphonate ABC transporter, permease protein PhnE [Euryarchaeota archaeon]MDP6220830.1 phosphonate ABC transporter, permease protein PhnE [Candidatus Thalassarchaeaceae archaeon]MBV43715.1 phosphonate ABC transporter, permease protein PhnE [Euryarchaeota archaeon]MDP7091974.1 phosphonate ABC transporter, permease protein PhnE [Candidatus Thalassarchaeaceae archaeon]MDP7257226.1 phosphonate ABC transporter, permease protein PhnE [Candidatus Thalassarchaeaceae archaeon]|tara:strand:+ start:2720 stop:3622 length:903 start_codon:yes stop_codon:yes gene_type:complete